MRNIALAAAAAVSAFATPALAQKGAPVPPPAAIAPADDFGPVSVSLAASPGGEPVVLSVPGPDGAAYLRAPRDGDYWLVVESRMGGDSRLARVELEVRIAMAGGAVAELPPCSGACAAAAEPMGLTLAEGDVAEVRVRARVVVTGSRINRHDFNAFRPLS